MSDDKSDDKDPVKKRKSRIETEKKILSAALSVFSELGYDAASIQTIASRANVNGALIIRYFGSKSGLLRAILVDGCELNVSLYSCSPREDDLEKEIARFFLSEIRMDYEHYEFLRLVFMRAILDPEIEDVLKHLHVKNGRQDLADCLKPFQDKGEIPQSMDLMELSYILHLHGMGIGTTVHIFGAGDRAGTERRALISAKLLAEGLKASAAEERLNSPKKL